jgi:ribosomal protein S18 acetylase RimI-like enzyme
VRDARRNGLGSAAFDLLLREVVNDRRLVLEVLTSNPTGHAFWRSLGLDEYSTSFQIPGQ